MLRQLINLRLFFCILVQLSTLFAGRSYDGYKIIRVEPISDAQMDAVRELQRTLHVKIIQEAGRYRRSVDFLAGPNHVEPVIEQFENLDVYPHIVVENVANLIEQERNSDNDADARREDISSFRLDRYHSYDEITDYLFKLADEYRHLCSVKTIGYSSQGRPLIVLKVGKNTHRVKPAIWVDAGMHAREWISPATALYFIHKLLTGASRSDVINNLLVKMDWYFLPLVNPDGYEYSRLEDRMWRKTRSKHYCHWWSCCYGVDPNRNFGHHWGEDGASSNPCSDIYQGRKAFSEPETEAMSDFILSHNQTIKAYITLHAFAQYWLIPFGYSSDIVKPRDYDELVALNGARAIAALHGTNYTVGNSAEALYAASGASDDWAKSVGIKYAYTIELRPAMIADEYTGFFLPPSQIIPTAEETWLGVKVVAEQVIADEQKQA